jgi:hypothetical protein
MRTKNFFKGLATSVALLGLTGILNAQNPTGLDAFNFATNGNFKDTVTVNETTEFVTVSSEMPYYTHPDVQVRSLINSGVYKPSVFKWDVTKAFVSGGSWTTADYKMTDTTTATPLHLAGAGYVAGLQAYPFTLDSIIGIQWLKVGATYKIWNYENPVSNTPIAACPGTPTGLPVNVLAKPTIQWSDRVDSSAGGCGVDNNIPINILVDLTGSDLFKITYDSAVYNLAGVVQGTPGTKTISYAGVTGIFANAANVEPNFPVTNVKFAPGTYGYVKYTLGTKGPNPGSFSDRISRKSLGRTANAGDVFSYVVPAPGANLDGTLGTVSEQVYTVYSLPTPSKTPIKHVTNLGW